MKVLITDDSSTIRMMLKGLLKQLQITDVVEAPDGKDALAKVAQTNPDLMLLDIHMPNMDGLSCLAELKQRPEAAHIPVIIISSDTVPDQLEKARTLGAHAFIKKPFRLEGLREAIAAAFPAFPLPAAPVKSV
jgi:CheY-like chemotaxis protein